MRTTEGYRRLTAFADAVVAIAITLLVLPLVELRPQRDQSVAELLTGHGSEFFAFFLSFAVIARLWTAYHAVGEHLARYDGPVVGYTFLWLATIAFLPFPTALLADTGSDRALFALYIGTLLINTLALAGLVRSVTARAQLRAEGVSDADAAALTINAWSNPVLLLLALVVALILPGVGLLSLLLLALDPLLVRLGRRWGA